jgi:hypothetical protein
MMREPGNEIDDLANAAPNRQGTRDAIPASLDIIHWHPIGGPRTA